ncbi:MAG: hypothetical protein WD873_06060, partial [Candidatus Hydrogenedentales bacterium]
MAFTDHCGIFSSVHEEAFNLIIAHVRSQRPSLFNYATAAIAEKPELLCAAIEAHQIVRDRGNPTMTTVDPLPVPGSDYGLNFAVQLVDLRIDFHPGDEFALPPELSPPLPAQRLAIKLKFCGGIGCPPRDRLDEFIPPPTDRRFPDLKLGDKLTRPTPANALMPLPTTELICFCLEAFATGGFRTITHNQVPYLELVMDGL